MSLTLWGMYNMWCIKVLNDHWDNPYEWHTSMTYLLYNFTNYISIVAYFNLASY